MMGREIVPHTRVLIELNADVKDLEWWDNELDLSYRANPDIKCSQIGLRTADPPLASLAQNVEWQAFGEERTC